MTLVLRDETECLGPDSELEDAIIRHNTSITDEMSWMMRVRSLFDPTCLEYAYEIAKHIHAIRTPMLRTRSVNAFGRKNAGKSTLVRGIWHVEAAAGRSAGGREGKGWVGRGHSGWWPDQ